MRSKYEKIDDEIFALNILFILRECSSIALVHCAEEGDGGSLINADTGKLRCLKHKSKRNDEMMLN